MNYTTYNNVSIPSFMYGTAWKKEATGHLVQLAVSSGFRAIDTANQIIHYHEALVGEALRTLDAQGIKRDQLFLQTKFTPVGGQDNRTPYDSSADLTTQVGQSFESSLQHLHTEYVDSYVLHGPYSRMGLGAADWEVWKAMEGIYKAGRTKMVGVKPMVVQKRCYALLAWDKEVREICQAHGIIYQGFSLLTANRQVLGDPELWGIAQRLGTGLQQVIFRFAMQIGMLPLTGTTSEQHMKEDLQVERLELTPEETQRIEMIAV